MFYTYKNNTYQVVNIGKMKHPETRQWVEAVFYRSILTQEMFAREAKEFFSKFTKKPNAPYHIQAIGKFYPILKTEGNIANGEIKHFNFVDSCKGTHRTGQRVVGTERIGDKSYDAIWVHLAQDYFKLIGLWPE